MFEGIAASWPLDLCVDGAKSPSTPSAASPLRDLATFIRAGVDPVRLQSALLSKHSAENEDKEGCEVLLCWLAFEQLNYPVFDNLLTSLWEKNPTRFEVRVLKLWGWLWRNDVNSLKTASGDIWLDLEHSYLLQLCKAAYYLATGNLPDAEHALSRIPGLLSPEMAMLKASLLSKKGDESAAIQLLLSQLHRCPAHIRYYRQLLCHMIDGKDGLNVMACAHEALSKFGEHPEILYHFTTLNLYKRQPGLARRSALLQQISGSVRPTSINLGNQLASYEMNGQADWLDFLIPKVARECFVVEPQLQANLVMQFASIQSKHYQPHLHELVSTLEAQSSFMQLHQTQKALLGSRSKGKSPLSVAWITGDCTYHPVARFLYGWFASCSCDLRHRHVLVNLEDHRKESYCDLYRSISGIDVQDVSGLQGAHRLLAIRKQNYDVVVDLSGWTGGNFIAGLHARLAPVQVNYLGYFASSGLPSMDYWLGDTHLFPDGCSEWATESLFRIPRPFLAWTPQSPLPEANISVSMAPTGPIHFGSFNHNRKLSDATLRLWGQLLTAVPEAFLVLKASAQSDSDTQRLLRRRMLRQGLDPDRVKWLALTKGLWNTCSNMLILI